MKTPLAKTSRISSVASLLLAILLLWAGSTSAQVYRAKLEKLDGLLQQPLRNQLITDEAYAGVLYQKQVSLTGLAVQQGQTLGTSVTLGDKSASLNLGVADIKLKNFFNTALIGTARFNADQGYVKLFSQNDLRVTAGYGGTVLFFGNGHSTFSERAKKDFQWKLRELRKNDKAKLGWHDTLTPRSFTQWEEKYVPLMDTFIQKWRLFQQWLNKNPTRADRFYEQNGDFNPIELADLEGERLYLDYLDAEHAVLPILDDGWDSWHRAMEVYYIKQQLGISLVRPPTPQPSLTDTLKHSSQFNLTLTESLRVANEAALKKRYEVYDSLQQHVRWVSKTRSWVTVSTLYNTVEQSIFNAANQKKTYADVYRDDYWQVQANYNGFREGEKANLYLSLGVGTSNQLAFKKADLHTYQTSEWQRTGADSALIVTQKSLYASVPTRVRYLNLQAQLTATLNQLLPGWGFTTTYEAQVVRQMRALHNITLGVIVPVRTGQTTLLLIPQARARGIDLPDRWSFGFTATATIPNFLVNTFK